MNKIKYVFGMIAGHTIVEIICWSMALGIFTFVCVVLSLFDALPPDEVIENFGYGSSMVAVWIIAPVVSYFGTHRIVYKWAFKKPYVYRWPVSV